MLLTIAHQNEQLRYKYVQDLYKVENSNERNQSYL